jgi:hypothetical protein
MTGVLQFYYRAGGEVLGDNDAMRRKMTAKLATLTRLARYDQLGIVTSQYVFYDSQPQPDSSVLAGTSTIGAKEALGEARNIVGRDAFTRIGYDKVRAVIANPPG